MAVAPSLDFLGDIWLPLGVFMCVAYVVGGWEWATLIVGPFFLLAPRRPTPRHATPPPRTQTDTATTMSVPQLRHPTCASIRCGTISARQAAFLSTSVALGCRIAAGALQFSRATAQGAGNDLARREISNKGQRARRDLSQLAARSSCPHPLHHHQCASLPVAASCLMPHSAPWQPQSRPLESLGRSWPAMAAPFLQPHCGTFHRLEDHGRSWTRPATACSIWLFIAVSRGYLSNAQAGPLGL